MQEYLQTIIAWMMTSGIKIIIVAALMFISLKTSTLLVNRIFDSWQRGSTDGERQKRMDTLKSISRSLMNAVIFFVGVLIIMQLFGIAIGPILTAAGILGLAVGFGAQNLVQDIISGFFILLDDQIRVGDVVQLGDKGGLVEKVNLRMVIMRDASGNVHYVRNGSIGVVTNMTKEYSRYVFEIGVAYNEDIDAVIAVLKEVDEQMRQDANFKNDILEPLEVLGLDRFGDSALIIKARTKTKCLQQWRIAREFNRKMKIAFDKHNIEIPFPHRKLIFASEAKDELLATAASGSSKRKF